MRACGYAGLALVSSAAMLVAARSGFLPEPCRSTSNTEVSTMRADLELDIATLESFRAVWYAQHPCIPRLLDL